MTEDGELIRTYNLPVGGHVVVENGQKVKAGEVIVKIPRAVGKAGDITGGLPRVTELFEARNPSNPAVVSEIDGEVTMGKVKRGNREIVVTSKTGEVKKYLVPLSKQILVQENDYVRAGTPLSDGAITPADILAIKGPTAVQEYIVNEVQDVYRLQGVKINDKHFEIIVRQMMRKVQIDEPGDTRFLEQQVVDKLEFMEENDRIWGKKVVVDAGDSQNLQPGASAGRHTVVMEQIPFAPVFHNGVVGSPAYYRSQDYSLIGERTIRTVTDGVAQAVGITGRVGEVILSVILVHPACFKETAFVVSGCQRLSVFVQDHYGFRFFGKLQHVRAEFGNASGDGRLVVCGESSSTFQGFVVAIALQLSAPQTTEVHVVVTVSITQTFIHKSSPAR